MKELITFKQVSKEIELFCTSSYNPENRKTTVKKVFKQYNCIEVEFTTTSILHYIAFDHFTDVSLNPYWYEVISKCSEEDLVTIDTTLLEDINGITKIITIPIINDFEDYVHVIIHYLRTIMNKVLELHDIKKELKPLPMPVIYNLFMHLLDFINNTLHSKGK